MRRRLFRIWHYMNGAPKKPPKADTAAALELHQRTGAWSGTNRVMAWFIICFRSANNQRLRLRVFLDPEPMVRFGHRYLECGQLV